MSDRREAFKRELSALTAGATPPTRRWAIDSGLAAFDSLPEEPRLHRINIEDVKGGVRICRGEHGKHEGCEWEFYVSPETAEGEIGYIDPDALKLYRRGQHCIIVFPPTIPVTPQAILIRMVPTPVEEEEE